MDEKKVHEMIQKRLQEEPEFRKKYDDFLARRRAEGKITENDLEEVSGGMIFGIQTCPKCGEYTL